MKKDNRNTDDRHTTDEDLAWEEVRTEHIVQDEWIDFRRSAYRFPDGSIFEPYYSYSRKNYVVIVATDEEGNYLCVRQYRQGIGEVTTEFPAGCIEGKDGNACAIDDVEVVMEACIGENETADADKAAFDNATAIKDALEAAKRELKEETGCESDEWRYLITVPSDATIADNYAFVFEAKNCRRASAQKLDDTEFLNVRKHTSAEIENLVSRGKFQQAVHVMAWLLAEKSR